MAAAVLQRGGFAVLVEEQNDVLAKQPERLRPVLEIVERDHRVPEAAQDTFCLVVSIGQFSGLKCQVSFSTALSCHEPSASFDRPTMARNSMMPATVIRNSAANMRGISSWKPGLQDFVGEPGVAAAGAGDELGDHGADQRQAARDAQAGEEERQGAGNAQIASASAAARRG